MEKLERAEWLTVEEAAAILRIGRGKAYELVRSGELQATPLGRSLRIHRSAIAALAPGAADHAQVAPQEANRQHLAALARFLGDLATALIAARDLIIKEEQG